jgi:hypothetical protein
LVVPAKFKKPAKSGAVEGIEGGADARVEFEVDVDIKGVAVAAAGGETAGVVVLEPMGDTIADVADRTMLSLG